MPGAAVAASRRPRAAALSPGAAIKTAAAKTATRAAAAKTAAKGVGPFRGADDEHQGEQGRALE
jgi:hypothetical protein